nr:alanine:cation symporter family protein [Clostridium rectalis]
MLKLFGDIVSYISSSLWYIFLPFIIFIAIFINIKTRKFFNVISKKDKDKWNLLNIKASLSISLSSKIGTGAIIGVLAAMWKTSQNGIGGESIVLWVIIGMCFLVPVTYSEVLFSQITKKNPRKFIDHYINKTMGAIYAVSLVVLYSFGFVGFQMTGIQSVINIFSKQNFGYEFTQNNRLFFIVLPIIIIVTIIVITKNYKLFINTLGSLVALIVLAYGLLFISFLILTKDFIFQYIDYIWKDFINIKSVSIGMPIGFIIGLQRIIQISETGLGTSALASSDSKNSPRREALLQTISTIITTFIAVIITSYIFTYGRYNLDNISLTGNGFERISSYLYSVISVTGYLGEGIIIMFFILSGLTTVLGSFHFLNTTISISENRRIAFYIVLISLSGLLSISNFDVIFDAADLLMFIVASINMSAIFIFINKDIKSFKIN